MVPGAIGAGGDRYEVIGKVNKSIYMDIKK